MNRSLYFLLIGAIIFGLASCDRNLPVDQLELMPEEGRIDLADIVSGDWDRVCVAGPYSTSGQIKEITGVPAIIEFKSTIFHSDSIALLVFLHGDTITRMSEVSRRPADFTSVASLCFARTEAVFLVPEDGHPFVQAVMQ